MSNVLPHEPTLRELASEVSRLRERVEDLEDLRDLLAAEHAGPAPVIAGYLESLSSPRHHRRN